MFFFTFDLRAAVFLCRHILNLVYADKKCYTQLRPKLRLLGDSGQNGMENKNWEDVGYLKQKILAWFK